MDKKVCPKMDTPLPFWEKTRGTRCFAELFGGDNSETIYAVASFDVRRFPGLSSGGYGYLSLQCSCNAFYAITCAVIINPNTPTSCNGKDPKKPQAHQTPHFD
jgi:hypothetical protein